MNFKFEEALERLQRTPFSLEQLLSDISEEWIQCHEGEGTWTVKEVIDHLIECEKTNWIPRVNSILDGNEVTPLPPFDRFAHLQQDKPVSFKESISTFKTYREKNVLLLKELVDPQLHLNMKGIHPAFGEITLKQLLSTWVVHDFTHISQILRVMAKRYSEDVGPWNEYLSILK
ncbi:DinB family protein [Bacillus salitolerans]|uniref:DinB family protein n=1 Tax=Bacillus salitolerans TaxID=1437434 RepID=A0ABW4LYG1_9BACI